MTHGVSCPTIPTLSVHLTHSYVTIHIHTGSVIHLQESLHPSVSGTKHTEDPQPLHHSHSPRLPLPPSHTHTHTQPIILSHLLHRHIRQSSCLPHTYLVSVTHVICVTQTVATLLLKHSLVPMLRGLQPGCQPKIPQLQFHVLSDEKISWTGVEKCVRRLFLCLPNPPSCWPRSLTQLEVSVQDASLVQVLESGKDLPKVVAHLWLQQGVPGLPDVGQGLQRATASAPRLPSRILPPLVLAEEKQGSNFGS